MSPGQIDRIWNVFGGSCWEISRFLGDLLPRAEGKEVTDVAFEEELGKILVQMRSLFVEYAGLYKQKRRLLGEIRGAVREKRHFQEDDLAMLVDCGMYDEKSLREELIELVRQNFLAYNPVTAEYAVQGRSMEIGLEMYTEMISTK